MSNRRGHIFKKISLVFLIVALYNLWTLKPVTILYTGTERFNDVVVDHLPLTDRDRIQWFRNHKEELKNRFNIGNIFYYKIFVWDVGNGFTNHILSRHSDLYCFDKMQSEKNCIDKNRLLTIEVYIDGNEIYTVHGYSDITYTIGKDGIIKMNRDEHFFERVYENVMQSINPLNYL